jgi:hypothetical protein
MGEVYRALDTRYRLSSGMKSQGGEWQILRCGSAKTALRGSIADWARKRLCGE